MSKFWDHYEAAKGHVAAGVDDVRHTVVERGWYGREVTGNIAAADVSTQAPEAEQVDAELVAVEPIKLDSTGAFYAETRSGEVRAIDLYGQSPTALEAPAIEAPRQEAGYEPEP